MKMMKRHESCPLMRSLRPDLEGQDWKTSQRPLSQKPIALLWFWNPCSISSRGFALQDYRKNRIRSRRACGFHSFPPNPSFHGFQIPRSFDFSCKPKTKKQKTPYQKLIKKNTHKNLKGNFVNYFVFKDGEFKDETGGKYMRKKSSETGILRIYGLIRT